MQESFKSKIMFSWCKVKSNVQWKNMSFHMAHIGACPKTTPTRKHARTHFHKSIVVFNFLTKQQHMSSMLFSCGAVNSQWHTCKKGGKHLHTCIAAATERAKELTTL